MSDAAAPGASLREVVEAVVERHAPSAVGLVVGVHLGQERAFLGRGRVGADRDRPPDRRTIFELGSITKTFTATALAVLAGEGLVALDEPVADLLPAGWHVPVRGRPITLLDLATHTSGLPRLPPGLLRRSLLRSRDDPYAWLDDAELARSLRRVRLRAEPGRRPRYSNLGYGLLGRALAERAGTSYELLVRGRVCEPLGLVDTVVEVPEPELVRLADGHTRRGSPTPHWHLAALAGAGALRSTAEDALRFLEAQLAPPEGPLGVAIRATHEGRARVGPLEQCLGWIARPLRDGGRLLWHDGGTGGFRSFAAFAPEHDLAVVALASSARSVDGLGLRLVDALARGA